MDKIIRNILKKIEHEGFEAYIIGGFVRDSILGIESFDIDICTNARPMDLKNIFPINQSNNYGGFRLKIKQYNIDITTYRKEKKYDNRRPQEVEYVNNLIEDIKRRDFTINSLCMDKNGNITDLLDGRKDLNNKLIKVIGSPDTKFTEDPLRILRAIRFATILDFTIEEETYESIKRNYKLVGTLSDARIKEELTKILCNYHYARGLDILKKVGITDILGLKYDNIVYTTDLLGMWAQISINRIKFTNNELNSINKIRKIVTSGKITYYELFNYGLYLCMVAGDILGVSHAMVNSIYKSMPIKSMAEIDIDGKEVINMLNIEPSKIVAEIINDVKNAILFEGLKNNKADIKKYIIGKWQK